MVAMECFETLINPFDCSSSIKASKPVMDSDGVGNSDYN
jgi:hypothetical protein